MSQQYIMVKFEDIKHDKNIYLYAGDMALSRRQQHPFIGLSLRKSNDMHIKHDITLMMDINDNSVDIYQSEDVMEHIEYDILPTIINEIYRVLKHGGLFRLSMPDYRCDVLYNRSIKDKDGTIIFDAGGGGRYDKINKKVINGGHVWFPTYESVLNLIKQTKFSEDKIKFLHYYTENNDRICNEINYELGYISRTPDHDKRVKNPRRPMSIVVDLYKT